MKFNRLLIGQALGLIIMLAVCLNFSGCPDGVKDQSGKVDKGKAAAYGIQRTVDGSKSTLAILQTTNKLTPDDVIALANYLKAINKANDTLIDAAWAFGDAPNGSNREAVLAAVPYLEKAINEFVDSEVVVKNSVHQAEIKLLANELSKQLQIILNAVK